MAAQSECKAKDPKLCRYHGALLVMEEAAKNGDVQKWLLARDEVAAAAKKKKIFHGEERTIPEMPSSLLVTPKEEEPVKPEPIEEPINFDDYDEDGYSYHGNKRLTGENLRKKIDRDSDRMDQERTDYLRLSEAVPTPMEAYALWLSVWESQQGRNGKKISNIVDSDYNTKSRIFGNRNTVKGKGESILDSGTPAYDDISWDRWTPTNGNMLIPTGYGSGSLELFIMPDIVPQHMASTSGDHREGWEYGHTTVYILERDENSFSGWKATTNDRSIGSYRDVEAYRKGKSIQQLAEALSRKQDYNAVDNDGKKELG